MTVPMGIGGRRTARLDALPLALELTAPWIKVLTPEDLVRRLEHDVLFSTAGPRDLPERQRTMNATVAWSYQLLGPNEQRVFRRLGMLAGRFPIKAAAAVVVGREGTSARSDEALGAAAGALTWLIDRDRPTEACDIAWSLFFFWAIRGHAAEGLRWYEQILSRPSIPPAVETRALLGAGAMLPSSRFPWAPKRWGIEPTLPTN